MYLNGQQIFAEYVLSDVTDTTTSKRNMTPFLLDLTV